MEMDIRRTRTCERCQVVVPLDKVRLFPKDREKNILVCDTCCDELKNRTFPTPGARGLSTVDYATYFCNRCSSSFRADRVAASRSNVLYCTYCGKNDSIAKK